MFEMSEEMNEIDKNIEALIASIKISDVYEEYKKQEALLLQEPDLFKRVNQFRENNFRMQEEANSENLFHIVDQVEQESSQLRKIPEVNAYLDAELALCKLMQRICRTLTEAVEMDVPEL
jgi:cell fate (sporulation/competence/biofilm development) regulator YlbF (YheA/YmcA/DUF963 family)